VKPQKPPLGTAVFRGFLFLCPLAFLFSCAGLSSPATVKTPLYATSPETVRPEWRSLSEGLSLFEGKTRSPRLEFKALRVELLSPQIFVVTSPAGKEILSMKVSSFVEREGLIAGINTTPFDPSSAREGEPRRLAGIAVFQGRLLSPPNPRYGALVFYRNRRAAILPQGLIENRENIEYAAGGFHLILEKGELTERALNTKPRYARSAAGLSENGAVLYLLVIDGRRAGNAGATEAETAILLRQLGAEEGLNLDGGGSSALALRFPGTRARVINSPAHQGIPGRERAVAACLGVGVLEL
jgi:exopolysaccharide biosynthesis protein